MSVRTLTLAGLGVSFMLGSVVDADQIFWADRTNAAIAFANRDGTLPGSFPGGGSNIIAVAVDALHGKVYWGDNTNAIIKRSNLDGSNVESVRTGVNTSGMEVDPVGGKVYWLGTGSGVTLRRANVDGTGAVETLFNITTPFIISLGFALDLPNNAVYLPDIATGTLYRVNLDGSNLTVVLTLTGVSIDEVVLDPTGGRLYWIACSGALQSSDLSGGDIQTIVPADLTRCRTGLALDPAIGKLYWSSEEGFISRVNIDGSGIEPLVTPGSTMIEKIALDTPVLLVPVDTPASSTWGLLVMATLLVTFGTVVLQRRIATA